MSKVTMLSANDIERIAADAARRHLGTEIIDRITSADTIDSEGREAVRITVILVPNAARKLGGDAALDTLVEIQQKLAAAGESRLATIDYGEAGEIFEESDPAETSENGSGDTES